MQPVHITIALAKIVKWCLLYAVMIFPFDSLFSLLTLCLEVFLFLFDQSLFKVNFACYEIGIIKTHPQQIPIYFSYY